MKSKLIAMVLFVFTLSLYGQEFINGSLITTRYDTISDVKIKVMNDAKSLLHLTYIDKQGIKHSPKIEDIKCYTRGEDVFCRIYNSGEMIMVKQLVKGEKLNLYKRSNMGLDVFYVEKVFDELIKVPGNSGKFKKVMSQFLSAVPEISARIKSKELQDISTIVKLYNES